MYSSQVWRVARRRQKQMPGPWKQQVHIYPDVNFDPKYPGNFKSIQQCPPMRHVFFFFFCSSLSFRYGKLLAECNKCSSFLDSCRFATLSQQMTNTNPTRWATRWSQPPFSGDNTHKTARQTNITWVRFCVCARVQRSFWVFGFLSGLGWVRPTVPPSPGRLSFPSAFSQLAGRERLDCGGLAIAFSDSANSHLKSAEGSPPARRRERLQRRQIVCVLHSATAVWWWQVTKRKWLARVDVTDYSGMCFTKVFLTLLFKKIFFFFTDLRIRLQKHTEKKKFFTIHSILFRQVVALDEIKSSESRWTLFK